MALHHVGPEACKQCHEEIYNQWKGSIHAASSAVKDPIHGAFYRNVVGDPTEEGVRLNGKYPVCLKCHAPVAALDKKTKLDAAEAYANGVSCVTCHSFKGFKGNDTADGKPLYGVDAYEVDSTSLHGPAGNTYTTDRVAEGAAWPTPIHHPVPLQGNAAALVQEQRHLHGLPREAQQCAWDSPVPYRCRVSQRKELRQLPGLPHVYRHSA